MDVALSRPPRGKRSRVQSPKPAKRSVVKLDPANWAKWKAQLARRKAIRLPGDGDRESALLWGTADCLDSEGRALLRNVHRALQTRKPGTLVKAFDRWFAGATPSPSVQTALEAIAWARALTALAQVIEGEAWCAALDSLHALASAEEIGLGDQALVFQLLRVELAATLARHFSELSFAKPLAVSAEEASARLLQSVLDDDGLPASDRLSLVRPLWASWVRCRQLEPGGSEIFAEPSRGRLDRFFRQALRLTRTDGSPVLGGSRSDAALLAATEQAAVTPTTRRIVAAVRGAVGGSEKGLPHPPWYSEKRGLAVLRTRWSPLVDQATVRFFAAETDVEWQAGGRVLGSGPWSWQATVNGQPLAADGNWEEVCWHSDADVDYLELELPLSGGWALQRQILLGRLDRFLYLADVLVGNDAQVDENAELRFTSSWPLSEGLRFEGAKETRDGFFVAGGKRLASATPLAMPEWRADYYPAEFAATEEGELQVSAVGRGKNLYCPLWIDLDSRRTQQPLTWRRLTVGENLETVGRDVAVGYRMQCGAQQWLIYRSLGQQGNRTVLGQNYSTEFVVCRFQRDGQTVDLLEIQ